MPVLEYTCVMCLKHFLADHHRDTCNGCVIPACDLGKRPEDWTGPQKNNRVKPRPPMFEQLEMFKPIELVQ